MSTCNWPLGNGGTLDFTVYNLDATWNRAPGLYIFAYWDGQYWHALYIGQTDDFSTRIPYHERLYEVRQYRDVAIHALGVPQAANRDNWERMLIQHLQPPLNVQGR